MPKIEIVDLYEPDLEEDLAVLEEIEFQDLEKLKKEVIIEPEKTNELIKQKEKEQKEDDVLEFIDEVEKRLMEVPTIDELGKPRKFIDKDNELLSIELIKTLSDKMEKQLREGDNEGYIETKKLLKKAAGKL